MRSLRITCFFGVQHWKKQFFFGRTKVCRPRTERGDASRGISVSLHRRHTLGPDECFSFHRKHSPEQPDPPPTPHPRPRGRTGCNKSLASPPTIISIAHRPCHFPAPHHSQSRFFFFITLFPLSYWPGWRGRGSGSSSSVFWRQLCLCHSLMSWDSSILARVFFTLRAVRRDAGLWAQHSDISFPICRRHCRHQGQADAPLRWIHFTPTWELQSASRKNMCKVPRRSSID